MKHIHEFVDERQKSWCIHCSRWIDNVAANRDHAPSKSFLQIPYPENLPVVEICKECNSSFSLDEEYFVAFLSSVISGSTNHSDQCIPAAKRILQRNESLRNRINNSRCEMPTTTGGVGHYWRPETERIKNIVLKNARGHVFFEYGEPMLEEPSHIEFVPLEVFTKEQRDRFETIEMLVFPEVGSRMLSRMMAGYDFVNSWVNVQDEVYRYAVVQCEGMLVRTVLYEFLATEVYWTNS